jgi:lipopolysaccharide export system protein LptA
MQRTIRFLKPALLVAFFAVLGYIIYSFNPTARRNRNEGAAPVATARENDQAEAEAKTFRDVQTIGGRVVSEIVADRVVSYQSKWTTLENARITIYRPNNLTYQLSCPAAEFNSETKEANAKGGVKLVSSDGVEISTAEIRFDGNRLTNDIPVQFRIDRWTGDAGALDLDVPGETLRLHKNITATMAPAQPLEQAMTLKAVQSVFQRAHNTVTFDQTVELNRGAERLYADSMVGRFTQDRRQIIGLEGRGNVKISMAANVAPGEDLGGRKDITCDNFSTEIGPDGQISAINARGADRPAHAVLYGPPRRELDAQTFRIALANRAVSDFKADGQVVMKELADVTRDIHAEHVTVLFDPGTRRARVAHLEGAFRYADPKTTASAFRANYDIAGDRIVLTTDPGWQATVVSEGHTLKAKQIEFSPRAQTARATGNVIAELRSTKGKSVSADTTGVFPAGKPVFVNSDEVVMRQQNRTALFSGNVRAWQETNVMLANELQVQGAGDTITARGNVRTTMYNTGDAKRTAPVKSTSEQLHARKNERRLDLLGSVTIVDDVRTLKSEKAAFYFDGNRKIDRIEAENGVNVTESTTSRKGTGEKAVYHVNKKMIYVHGSPATMTDPTGSIAGHQIVFDLNRSRVQVVSPETKGTYKHPG